MYMQITSKCLSQILDLQYLQHLVLASCVIDEESVAVPKLGCCKSLEVLTYFLNIFKVAAAD